jgi:hypothetical protein
LTQHRESGLLRPPEPDCFFCPLPIQAGAEELEPIEPETPLRHGHHRLKIKQGESLCQKIANEIIVRHRHHRLFMKKVKK